MGYISDIADQYAAGKKQSGIGGGLGLAARAATAPATDIAMAPARIAAAPITGAVDAYNAISKTPIAQGAANFGRALVTGSAAPPPPASIAAPPVAPPPRAISVAPAAPVNVPENVATGTYDAPVQPGAQPSAVPQYQTTTQRIARTAAPVAAEDTAAKYAAETAKTLADATALRNNGSIDGMIGAKHLLQQFVANRAATTAAVNADTTRFGAQSQDNIGTANANTSANNSDIAAFNANTNARGEDSKSRATDVGIEKTRGEIEKGALELQKQRDFKALNDELADPKTTPERRKQIEQILVAQHGRNPAQPKFQIVNDESVNEMGVITKTPYIFSEDGSVRRAIPEAKVTPEVAMQRAQAAVKSGANKDEVNKRLVAGGYKPI